MAAIWPWILLAMATQAGVLVWCVVCGLQARREGRPGWWTWLAISPFGLFAAFAACWWTFFPHETQLDGRPRTRA